MPIDLSNVNWTASNIPAGLSFNTRTGVFSGTPTEAGEYTVPVSVNNGYGTDQKDVSIVIEGTAYPVYAVGSKAATWSNNAEADENGFRKLPMPDAYKLLQHYNGFGAKTSGGKYYCCGVKDLKNSTSGTISSVLSSATTPTELTVPDLVGSTYSGNINEVRVVYLRSYTWTATSTSPLKKNSNLWEGYCMLIRYSGNKISHKRSNVRLYQVYESSGTTNTHWYTSGNVNIGLSSDVYKLPDYNVPTVRITGAGALYLKNDGSDFASVYYDTKTPAWTGGIITTLDYKAVKIFLPYEKETAGSNTGYCTSNASVFSYLSENKLLDNNASNFTFGTIRDAWVYMTKAYVVTEENKVYEKQGTAAWSFLGTYDVKKMIVPSTGYAFMLTNNGELYHKGIAISDIADDHTAFTQIFPDYYFYDIAFDSGTLTVLKED